MRIPEISMKKIGVAMITSLVLVCGCHSVPTSDIRIEAEVDPKANLSGYETYAWSMRAAILNDAYGQWEPPAFDADAEIKYLIDRELRHRGLSETNVDPDMRVAFAAGIDMDVLELEMDPAGKISALSVPKGALVVLLLDRCQPARQQIHLLPGIVDQVEELVTASEAVDQLVLIVADRGVAALIGCRPQIAGELFGEHVVTQRRLIRVLQVRHQALAVADDPGRQRRQRAR